MTQYRTDAELRVIARDLARGLIFTDWQIQRDEDVPLVFQALNLMTEAQNLELQTRDIACLYEYKTAAYDTDPKTGIPVFVSFNILTKEESLKVAEWFTEYHKILHTEKSVEI